MKLPKEYEGRNLILLLEGIPAAELKVTKITPDEIIGEYADGEEIHCSHEHLRAWWIGKTPRKGKPLTEEHKKKMKDAARAKREERKRPSLS